MKLTETDVQGRQWTAFRRLLDLLRAYEKGFITVSEFGAAIDELILDDKGFSFPFRSTLVAVKWGIGGGGISLH